MNRKVAVILVCLTAAGWLLSSRIVHDGIGEPDPPPRFAMNYRLSFPFARLKIDPVEMTFERRGDDLTVFVRCLEPVWAKPRQVRSESGSAPSSAASGSLSTNSLGAGAAVACHGW